MKIYAGQKAQQAMEALIEDKPLADRLNLARTHLGFADNEHFIEDASEVREAIRAMKESFKDSDIQAQARAVASVIEAIFEECGASEAIQNLNRD
jgi:hypothetical protein